MTGDGADADVVGVVVPPTDRYGTGRTQLARSDQARAALLDAVSEALN
jgi:hypothetical protein